jgi:hypothetical protein
LLACSISMPVSRSSASKSNTTSGATSSDWALGACLFIDEKG